MEEVRNFAILAHIDHGKSTLADRLIEITQTVPQAKMREQFLDTLPIERERGITIKLQPIRMRWKNVILNLIDTPGHVDFSYEVSRTLSCVEGIVLLVDASQGIQAQTLSNLYLAQKNNLTIIPVVNKIDLPTAEPDKTADEMVQLLGVDRRDILFVSGKTGQGIPDLLAAIIKRVPAPAQDVAGPFKALIFDSVYDPYRGVVAFVRVVAGKLQKDDSIYLLSARRQDKALEVGYFRPFLAKAASLQAGDIGYIATSLREVAEARVGDTVATNQEAKPIPGYAEPQPMVFASFYPVNSADFGRLREALFKLKLSDAAISFAAEHSPALGPGFRVGFLGLLHLEIAKERLEREYGLSLIATTPQVDYRGQEGNWQEPWVNVEIITPPRFLGAVMETAKARRAELGETTYLTTDRVLVKLAMPLSEMIVDFYDRIKSASSGFASVGYELAGYRAGNLVRLDILVAGERIEAFSQIVLREQAYSRGKAMVERLKTLIPRQMFEVRLQAALGSKVIAAASIPALRKDVTAKLYGGDVTRKRKLLEKQKEGKQKMKRLGRVDIPTEVFLKLLQR